MIGDQEKVLDNKNNRSFHINNHEYYFQRKHKTYA